MDWLFLIFIALVTLGYTLAFSPAKAFLNVYLTILILWPQIFNAKIPGLPTLNFAQACIIPIFIVFFINFLLGVNTFKEITKFNLLDSLVILFIILNVFAEYITAGSKEAINFLAYQLCDVFAPYFLARFFLIPKAMTVPFAKRFVFLFFIAILLCPYELIFYGNPFVMVFQKTLFPSQGYEWPTLIRYGFKRIGGPFVQPILFGIGIGTALLLHYWLTKNNLWEKRFRLFPIPYANKAAMLAIVLIIGLIFTFSRGPLVSMLVSAIFLGVGYASHRMHSLYIRLGVFACLLAGTYFYYSTTVEVSKTFASETTGNTIYRMELLENYMKIVWQRPYWGWSHEGVPIKGGQISIDNGYLLIALEHGLVVLTSLALLLLVAMLKLAIRGVADNRKFNADSSFAITLFSIILTLTLCYFTVWIGVQLPPLTFIFLGWASGQLHSKQAEFFPKQVEPFIRKSKKAAAT